MNKIVVKTTIGFLSLGLITGAGILTTNYVKHDSGLTYTAKNSQKSSSLKDMEQEMKQAEIELNEAKEDKEAAEQEVKNAEVAINEATKEKDEALAELESAKTPEEKRVAQAKVDAATSKIEQAVNTKKSAEKKVEEATKVVEEKEQNKKDVEEKVEKAKETENTVTSNKTSSSNSTTASKKTQSTTKNNTTTKQEEKSEEQGSKFDLSKYPELMEKINKTTEEQVKEIEEEAKKKTVEFHFYSANKELFISCRGDHCGEGQQGYIWFVELECDLNKCEGFTDPSSGNKVSTLLSGRRGDITEYTVTAPAAKYGYRFVGWELISTKKMATSDIGTGHVLGKYVATYEKIQ